MGAQHGPSIFTCTFCYCVSAEQPHVLGRSSRLTCPTCYTMIINLSICWVCGELIFRGTDCVSFGWCFWHRACYGCLLYGSRNLCAGVLEANERSSVDEAGKQRRSEEILEPPLCALCTTECEVDGLDDDGVLQRGLKRIDMVDGGVTRCRWAEKARFELDRCPVERALMDIPPASRVPIDHGKSDHSTQTVWINVNDPVNGRSFRPHPLKPIPQHMQAAPVNLDISPSQAATMTSPVSVQQDLSHQLTPTWQKKQVTTTRLRSQTSPSSHIPIFQDATSVQSMARARFRGPLVNEEPLMLASERASRLERHSEPCGTSPMRTKAPKKR